MDSEDVYRQEETVKRMAEAAGDFLASLQPDQRSQAQIDFGDETERKNWHYVPRARSGLAIKEMDGRQRERLHRLVETGLSAQAYEKARTIIGLEDVLAEVEGPGSRHRRDPELYHVSVFGTPGEPSPWGWRFEGHHISLNYTIVEGRAVAPTPIFFGANPAQVRHGQMEGVRALKEEEDLARELLASLDGEEKRQAVIAAEAPRDILTRNLPHVRGEVGPEGLSGGEMAAGQQEILKGLVEVYVRRLPGAVAEVEMGRVERANLATLHFAWAGPEVRGKGHYYRVQGPVFMAEYDNTQNDANHIHAVWRSLENDFGEDLLQRHYRQAHGAG